MQQYKPRYRKMNFIERLYFPAIIKGMLNALRHLFKKKFTTQYPEEKLPLAERFRGEHILKKDEQGRIKCVACFMCATACPARCITIVADEAPSDYGADRDKYPSVFTINELRCIFCGFCVEACPKDAIGMIQKIPRVYSSREEFFYDRETLLNNKVDD